jgi:coatomer subunit beta'
MKELALEVSTDLDQKFDLALSLDDLQKALSIVEQSSSAKKGGAAEPKWRSLGDRALALWNVELAATCFKNAGDLPALLLVYSSLGDRKGMMELAEAASKCSYTMGRSRRP